MTKTLITKEEALAVTTEIRKQIGRMAEMMIGAKQFAFHFDDAGNVYLIFKVGQNAKKVTHIRITLMPSDTYRMEFIRVYGTKFTVLADMADVYADSMHAMIELHTELHTGMYTRM